MSLRPLSREDLPLVLQLRNSSNSLDTVFGSGEINLDQIYTWFEGALRDPYSLWFVHQTSEGLPIGVVFFNKYDKLNSVASWGFYATSHYLREMGIRLGLDALDYAFSELKLYKINAEALAGDGFNENFYKKFGLVQEGLLRGSYLNGNSHYDVIRYSILATEWLSRRKEILTRILELDELAANRNIRERHTIIILTDPNSWIVHYAEGLIEEWTAMGHRCDIGFSLAEAQAADFCFCLGFCQILPPELLRQYKHTLVVHESELPKGRGWAPMTWQILEGENRIPVSLIEAVDDVDAGLIYLQEWIDLKGTELNPEWRAMQGLVTQKLCKQWISSYPSVVATAREQLGRASFYARRKPEDSKLDPNKTLAEQFNLLRVVNNHSYPAYFELNGRRFRVTIDGWEQN